MRSLLILIFILPGIASAETYPAPDRDAALAAARAVIASDPFMTLITTDAAGQPRARTIQYHGPDENFVFLAATIPGTRKLAQIASNPLVTLFFDNPAETAYVTIMGTATVHSDSETVLASDWRNAQDRERFWPDFPDGYVLIRIQPSWLEVVAPGISARDNDWRPQAVSFPP